MHWIARAARRPFTPWHFAEILLYGALAAALAVAVGALPARAQESQAKSWNLNNQEMARFEAKVVDILCELTGDCPPDCGGGARQLGLATADRGLVLVAKNGQPIFTGAVQDLLPYCGKQVEVDGLFTGLDDSPARIYQVQLIRETGQGEFAKTNRWTRQWNAAHPDLAAQKGPWFRKEPRINALIARDGYLGLGPDADKEVIE